MRKFRHDKPFSFFPFQDIITSVTGIMLLIVLLFAFDFFLQRVKTAFDESDEEARLQHLQEELSELRQEKQQLHSWLDRSHSEILEILEVDSSNLPERVEKSEEVKQHLQNRIQKAEKGKASLIENIKDTELEINKNEVELKDLNENVLSLQEQAEIQAGRIAEKKAILEKQEEEAGRLTEIQVEGVHDKLPIIMQCSDRKIKIKSPDGEMNIFSVKGQHVDTMLQDVERFLSTRNPRREFVTVLLKSSAAGYYQRVSGILRQFGFERGFEPFPEDWEVDF